MLLTHVTLAQCGFSNQIVALLKARNIQFKTFNILEDEEVRQGLKTYSNWPTYPQLYAGGTLIGGLDVVKELIELGELENELKLQRENDNTTASGSEKDSLQSITESTLKEKIQIALQAQIVKVSVILLTFESCILNHPYSRSKTCLMGADQNFPCW